MYDSLPCTMSHSLPCTMSQLALYVLTYLDARDLLRAAQTCRYWHTLAEDNLLWREKCQEEGITEALVFGQRGGTRRRGGVSGSGSVGGGAVGGGGKVPWKNLYIRQQTIERNWRRALRAPKVWTTVIGVLCYELFCV